MDRCTGGDIKEGNSYTWEYTDMNVPFEYEAVIGLYENDWDDEQAYAFKIVFRKGSNWLLVGNSCIDQGKPIMWTRFP